ncbi:hypothetical protein [Kitasatospora paranensis]|uniref:Integral membrane protein n=1 Tax=Kitasatospora paranensis TaxID=258053 RepID=A0ABW2FWA0_9ACTN
MKIYLALPVVLLASLFAASGVAAISRGWVLPMNRRHVRLPRRYGWGQLVVALALCWQLVFGLAVDTFGIRQWGTLTGSGVMLVGLVLMMRGQRGTGGRKDSSTQ